MLDSFSFTFIIKDFSTSKGNSEFKYLRVGDNSLSSVWPDNDLSSLLENIQIQLLASVLQLPDLLDEAGVLEGGLEADHVLLVADRVHKLPSTDCHLVILTLWWDIVGFTQTRIVFFSLLQKKLFESA